MKISQAVAAAMLAFGINCLAQAGNDDLDAHFAMAKLSILKCRMTYEIAINNAELARLRSTNLDPSFMLEAAGCVDQAKRTAGDTYKQALKSMGKQAAAIAALKRYQAKYLSTLSALGPSLNESRMLYNGRLARMESELEESANAVTLELN